MSEQKKVQTPQERYNSARGAWMFFVLATAINLFLGVAKAQWQFPFLSEIVRLVTELGDGLLFDGIGLMITLGYGYLWLAMEKNHALLTAAAGIYLVDTVLALIALINGSMDTMILLCVVIRLLLLWAMLGGIRAAKQIKAAQEMVILTEDAAQEKEEP